MRRALCCLVLCLLVMVSERSSAAVSPGARPVGSMAFLQKYREADGAKVHEHIKREQQAAFGSFTTFAAGSLLPRQFTALHTYFLRASGSDANCNGTVNVNDSVGVRPACAWSTVAHSTVVCGDVIIAEAANLVGAGRFYQNWGTVGGPCPSTSGGIDGTGGIYSAILLCATYAGCTADEMWMNKSNWTVEGFSISDITTDVSAGIQMSPAGATSGTTIGYLAAINNVCTGSILACFYAGGSGQSGGSASDEVIWVGNVAYNGAQGSSVCGSNYSYTDPQQLDALSGTHFLMQGNFGWAGINGFCGPNVNFIGGYYAASLAASSGTSLTLNNARVTASGSGSTLTVSSFTNGYISPGMRILGTGISGTVTITTTPCGIPGNFCTTTGAYGTSASTTASGTITAFDPGGLVVGYPIGKQGQSGIVTADIPQPNYVVGVSNNVVTLQSAITGTISINDSIATGQSTDADAMILDTWGNYLYTGQTYITQNLLWGHGGDGFIVICGGSANAGKCANGLNVFFDQNTIYGGLTDYKHTQYGAELFLNANDSSAWTLSVTNNIFQANVQTPASIASTYANVPTSGNGVGNPVVAAALQDNATISGNYFRSVPGTGCPFAANCTTGNNATYGTNQYTGGNTFGTDAGFANVAALPGRGTAPDCSGHGYHTGYDCMVGMGVIAAMVPSGGAEIGRAHV